MIGLETENIQRGLRSLMAIGYNLKIPVSPEQFADPALREEWRREKNMIVLQLWSDEHRRTPIDVFVYEPFDFAEEFLRAEQYPMGDQTAPIINREALIKLKRDAGRAQDLADIEKLEKIDILRRKQ